MYSFCFEKVYIQHDSGIYSVEWLALVSDQLQTFTFLNVPLVIAYLLVLLRFQSTVREAAGIVYLSL